MEEKLIRDALGSPVPQYLNLDLQMFAAQTLDGSIVTNGDIDFNKIKLLRDKLGSPIPQLWDVVNNQWTVATLDGLVVEGINFAQTKLLRDVLGSPVPQLWDGANNQWVAQTEISGSSGGELNLQAKSINITSNGTQVIEPDVGYDGLSSATIVIDITGAVEQELLYGFTGHTKPRSFLENNTLGNRFTVASDMQLHGFRIICNTANQETFTLYKLNGEVITSISRHTIPGLFSVVFTEPIPFKIGDSFVLAYHANKVGVTFLDSFTVDSEYLYFNEAFIKSASSGFPTQSTTSKFYIEPIFSIN